MLNKYCASKKTHKIFENLNLHRGLPIGGEYEIGLTSL